LPPRKISLYDVVVASIPVGYSTDRRPAIVVALVGDSHVQLAPCSSQWDLFVEGRDFRFPPDDPSTSQMGFIRESYAIGREFVEVPRSAVGKRLGKLGGQLAIDFTAWARMED
jgi:hypothetical protein